MPDALPLFRSLILKSAIFTAERQRVSAPNPDRLVVEEPGRPRSFPVAVAAEALVSLDSHGGREIVVEAPGMAGNRSAYRLSTHRINRQDVVIPDIERVNQVRTENMVPVSAVAKLLFGWR